MITKEDIQEANVDTLSEYARQLGISNAHLLSNAELRQTLLAVLKHQQSKLETPKAFFERVSALTDVTEIERECKNLIERLGTEKITAKSKANKLQPYSKLFKALTPTTAPAHLFFDFRSTPEQTPISRHVFFKFTGLADIDWKDANEKVQQRKIKSVDQLAEALDEENKIFSLTRYIETLKRLLNSFDCWELGVGLIAASGRRPSEIAMFGNFQKPEIVPNYIPYPEYAVQVSGLAKKREKDPTTIVSLLIPTAEFLQILAKFRAMPEVTKYREAFNNLIELGYDKSDAWNRIEDSIGNKFRSVTDTYFDFLPRIDDGQNRKNILLRASTLKLITMRDKPKATNKARITYAGVLAGHIIPIFKQDGSVAYNGQTSASTLNYEDYEPDSKNIPRISNIVKITEEIKETEDMIRITELESTVAKLRSEIATKDTIIADLERKLVEVKTTKEQRSAPLPDVKELDNKTLFSTKKLGSPDEKITRGWTAICAYNDNATENRIVATNQALRDLTGVNGQDIKKWLDSHQDEYISHHSKYDGMTKNNAVNPYYNKRYGAKKTEEIIDYIKHNYLLVSI